jgi:hypothetical protein
MVGIVTQVVEHLPNRCEALSSNPSTTKKKNQLINAYIYIYIYIYMQYELFWK